jgi:hypothetical protein
MHERWSSIAFSALLGIGALMAAPVGALTVNAAALRPAVTLSGNGWKFILDPRVGEDEIVQLSFSDHDWEAVESGADHAGRGLKSLSTRRRMVIAAVCQPLAARL